MSDNIDKIVEKLLSGKLNAEKIKAFSSVILALKGVDVKPVPNEVKKDAEPNDSVIEEDVPQDFSEVTGVMIDGVIKDKVKIYKNT